MGGRERDREIEGAGVKWVGRLKLFNKTTLKASKKILLHMCKVQPNNKRQTVKERGGRDKESKLSGPKCA